MSAILGLDLGARRIGIAIAGADDRMARPLTTLRRGRTVTADAAALGSLIDQHGIDECIVGLPIEAGGLVGPQAELTRAWATDLEAALPGNVRITFQDERLSSHLAEQRLGPMPRGRSGGPPTKTQRDAYRAKVDREAAAILLQDALDARRASENDGATRSTPISTTLETHR
jgi:putative Holliday junction resolvase